MLERRVSTRAFCRTADVWVVEVVVRCCGGPRVTYENVVLIGLCESAVGVSALATLLSRMTLH